MGQTCHDATFLRILNPHAESDITITCRRRPQVGALSGLTPARFFCHRAVLGKKCNFFQDESTILQACCVEPAAKRRRLYHELDADEDVVFELLRFIYCGTVHFCGGFQHKFTKFLVLAELLGIGGLINEPGVERWMCRVPTDALLTFFGPDVLDGSMELTSNVRRALLSKLAVLRPRDFSVEGLLRRGKRGADLVELHPGLVNLRVMKMSGVVAAELQVDWTTTVAEVIEQMRGSFATPQEEAPPQTHASVSAACKQETQINLVSGCEVLPRSRNLRDAGSTGGGSFLTVHMVCQIGRSCRCGQAAVQVTVRKVGPNEGRKYFKCAGLIGHCCEFFAWAD